MTILLLLFLLGGDVDCQRHRSGLAEKQVESGAFQLRLSEYDGETMHHLMVIYPGSGRVRYWFPNDDGEWVEVFTPLTGGQKALLYSCLLGNGVRL